MKVGQRLIFKGGIWGNIPHYQVGEIYKIVKITNHFNYTSKYLPNIIIENTLGTNQEWCALYYMDKSIWEPMYLYTKSKPSWL